MAGRQKLMGPGGSRGLMGAIEKYWSELQLSGSVSAVDTICLSLMHSRWWLTVRADAAMGMASLLYSVT